MKYFFLERQQFNNSGHLETTDYWETFKNKQQQPNQGFDQSFYDTFSFDHAIKTRVVSYRINKKQQSSQDRHSGQTQALSYFHYLVFSCAVIFFPWIFWTLIAMFVVDFFYISNPCFKLISISMFYRNYYQIFKWHVLELWKS